MEASYLGNKELLKLKKVAYFCSRNYSAQSVLRSYDWATELPTEICVVSTFKSPIEKDVLHFLFKRQQPVIIVLGKRQYRRVPVDLQEALDKGQLLIISYCSENQTRIGNEVLMRANREVLRLVTEVTFGYLAPASHLQSIYDEAKKATYIEKLTVL